MRMKIHTIYTCIILSIISLLAMIIVQCDIKCENFKTIIFAISSGVFGSTITSLIIFITEYKYIRREYLLKYYKSIDIFLEKIRRIRVMTITETIEEYSPLINSIMLDRNKKNWLKSVDNINVSELSREDKKEYYEINNYKRSVIDTIQDYIEVSNYNFMDIDITYSDICFLFSFSRKREKKLWNDFNEELRTIFNQIKRNSNDFNEYLNGESSNLGRIAGLVLDLQDLIFIKRERSEEKDDMIEISYYNELYTRMCNKLEIFRAKSIYKLKEPNLIEEYWALSSLKNRNNKI
ncbi:MAG: hypothetical protein IJV15_09030 [Lachnospiraceae bacterium]|nr:hypothetical protein [Lachnospiraceae bacterium]